MFQHDEAIRASVEAIVREQAQRWSDQLLALSGLA